MYYETAWLARTLALRVAPGWLGQRASQNERCAPWKRDSQLGRAFTERRDRRDDEPNGHQPDGAARQADDGDRDRQREQDSERGGGAVGGRKHAHRLGDKPGGNVVGGAYHS